MKVSSLNDKIESKRPSDAWLNSPQAKRILELRSRFKTIPPKTTKRKEKIEYAPRCLVTGKPYTPKKRIKTVIMQDHPIAPDFLLVKNNFKKRIAFNSVNYKFTTLTEILFKISEKYSVSILELMSKRRLRLYMPARYEYAFLARNQTLCSYPEIGKFLGGRDHTTIIHSEHRYIALQKMKANLIPIEKQFLDFDFDYIIAGDFS